MGAGRGVDVGGDEGICGKEREQKKIEKNKTEINLVNILTIKG